MKISCCCPLVFLAGASALLAQTGSGTITGVVSDPTGAVVSDALIRARNVDTGQVYSVKLTETGNYSIAELPAGPYELAVDVLGFKKYTRQGLNVIAAQVLRVDVFLEVGSQTETVTVTASATLLKTESAEVTHSVAASRLLNLPILPMTGSGAIMSGFRDPWAVVQVIPGTQYVTNQTMIVNGLPNATEQIRVEGQVAGNLAGLKVFTQQTQPSVDAIEEITVQTSNYSAEFGTVGGGILNVSMKSGTNRYHGSLYDYSVNEILNAAQPYTGLKNKQRRFDYGGALGGPVRIPKLYNGGNRTFFFWNFEQFRENQLVATTLATVPTEPYRAGDFGQVILGSGLNGVPRNVQVNSRDYVDPLGNKAQSGSIYDPFSTQTMVCSAAVTPNCNPGANVLVRTQFPSNRIPQTPQYLDSVAQKVLALVPLPTGPNAAAGQIGNNFQKPWLSHRTSQIPSLKLDHQVGSKGHMAFYWGRTVTESQYCNPNCFAEGFPLPITGTRGAFVYAPTIRINYDHTMTPTLLLHFGAGYSSSDFSDRAPVTDYDAFKELGLRGATLNRNFPTFAGGPTPPTGGMSGLGPFSATQINNFEHRPSASFSASWVKKDHTFKLGWEWRYEQYPNRIFSATAGQYSLGGGTTQTALQDISTSGTTGFAFADFLMGNVNGVSLAVPANVRIQKTQWALFLQDNWKITRKLTVDYGVRWDFGTYPTERYGRNGTFDPLIANGSAGSHPGGSIFEATCHCTFAANYPYAIGPRLGLAYQIDTRTVIRAGFGLVYSPTSISSGSILNSVSGGTPSFGQWLFQLQNGIPSNVQPQWPRFDAGAGLVPNTVASSTTFLDRNGGRPARQDQWSVGIQREVTRNLALEASYVANRGVWWSATLAPGLNDISGEMLAKNGFAVGNTADAVLLTQSWKNLTPTQISTLAARGVFLPYSGYDTNQAVRQTIRPFPQFSTAISPFNAPLGKTWYDSLQLVLTHRLSYGLALTANYTYSKTLDLMSSVDVFNRANGKNLAASDLPHQFRLAADYVTPHLRNGFFFSGILSDWGMGWFLQYQSAAALTLPGSNGTRPISQWLGRGPGTAQLAPGQSIWSTDWTDLSGVHHADPLDINCHCFDPTVNVVLNRNAWQNVPDGQWAANQSSIRGFRGFRRPVENFTFSRIFRLKEGITFSIRAEWLNVFNRLVLPQPATFSTNVLPSRNAQGQYILGFGTVQAANGTMGQRSGQFIGRLQF